MTFYLLTASTDDNVIGASYPQCKGMPSGEGLTKDWFDMPDSMTKLNNRTFPKIEPDLRFELEEDSILTDLVSPSNISARGLLLSKRAKMVLQVFPMMPHKFYSAQLKHSGVIYEYFWLHPVRESFDSIDFSNSQFHLANLAMVKIRDLHISSQADYIQVKAENRMKHVRADKLTLFSNSEERKHHVTMFPPLHSKILISQELKNSIQENNLTGFDFSDQSIL